MPAEYPRVLVCVLTYNPGPGVLATVGSLLRQNYPCMDVVVIDNASTDETASLVARTYPQVPLIGTGNNLGYCGGTNFALDWACRHGYDLVLVANPDIELETDAVARLVAAAESSPGVAVVGGCEVDFATGQVHSSGGRGFNLWTVRPRWLTEREGNASQATLLPVDYVQGSLVLYTRTALREGVRQNEDLFAYLDEWELGWRLRRMGLQAGVVPAVRVWHKRHPARRRPVEGYLILRNRCYLVRRYGCWYHRLFFFLYVGVMGLPVRVMRLCLQGHWRYARACVLGFWDGLRGAMGLGRSQAL